MNYIYKIFSKLIVLELVFGVVLIQTPILHAEEISPDPIVLEELIPETSTVPTTTSKETLSEDPSVATSTPETIVLENPIEVPTTEVTASSTKDLITKEPSAKEELIPEIKEPIFKRTIIEPVPPPKPSDFRSQPKLLSAPVLPKHYPLLAPPPLFSNNEIEATSSSTTTEEVIESEEIATSTITEVPIPVGSTSPGEAIDNPASSTPDASPELQNEPQTASGTEAGSEPGNEKPSQESIEKIDTSASMPKQDEITSIQEEIVQ